MLYARFALVCANLRKSAVNISFPNLAPFAPLRDIFRLLSAIDKFLFVVVSRQTKKGILCALCVSAVNGRVLICVTLRESAVNSNPFFALFP
jgi:hypothetical protein